MAVDPTRNRKLLMGTTGWTDPSLARCGKFFPASSRTAEDRLRYYSTQFPCVEVDSSNYAIPAKSSVQRWLGCVPKGFLFHFKAFGFFCSKSCVYGALPYQLKNQIQCPADSTVQLSSLSESQKCLLWQVFNDALLPVHQAAALGTVVFQFHLTFKPSEEHKAHVMWCRKNLDSSYAMAVEFRCRDWFNEKNAPATVEWLTENRIALVAADELEHETYLKGRLTDSPMLTILPVAWACTDPSYMYIRLHRREGTERILSSSELSTWEERLNSKLPHRLEGPVYLLWGTMWEDQAILNARNLAQRLGDIVLDWKSIYLASSKSTLQRFFKIASSDAVPVAGEERNDTHNPELPALCTGSGPGSPQAADRTHDSADELAELSAELKPGYMAQKNDSADNFGFHEGGNKGDKNDAEEFGDEQHESIEPEDCQFQDSIGPGGGFGTGRKGSVQKPPGEARKIKQLPGASKTKRKENPNLRSSSITSFFKRAAH